MSRVRMRRLFRHGLLPQLLVFEAVARLGPTATVWVVKDDRAEPRTVTTGLEGPERVEITQGLAGDERIVVQGLEGLYAGAPVREMSAARPSAPAGDPANAMPGMTGLDSSAKPKEATHGGH